MKCYTMHIKRQEDEAMHANVSCIACMIGQQEKSIRSFQDERKKSAYIHEVLKILYEEGQTHSCPWLLMRITEIYNRYFEQTVDYSSIKHRYNQYMLTKEQRIEKQIRSSEDRIRTCITYVCAGNYIDFGPSGKIDDSILDRLLEKAGEETVSETELESLKADLAGAKELVYLTDNCGEIVMDKIFIRILKEQYPSLHVTAILRGAPAINDATPADAEEVGLTELADCMGNGAAITGTDLSAISEEARQAIQKADVIISKGQGNFEGLYGEGMNPYFLFLCKCELFVRRFGLKQFSSVFAREDHLMGTVRTE